MGAVLLVVRAQLRSRTRSLAALTLIVALVAAVVLTAFAGARRTATAFERFRDDSRASDAWVQIDDRDPGAAERVAAIKDLPMVDEVAGYVISPTLPLDAPADTADFALIGDPFGRFGVEVDRPRLVAGRLPDPDSTDEVLLSRTAAQVLGRSAGDTLAVRAFSPGDITALLTGAGFPGFNGPQLELQVVGVGLWPEELGGRGRSAVMAGLVSPAFVGEHAETVGSWAVSARVRLAGGTGDLSALSAAVRAVVRPGAEVIITSAADDHVIAVQSAFDALATALLVFAAVAAGAGLIAVGQAVSRQVTATAGDTGTLGALGLSTRGRWATNFAPVALAAGAGTVIGAATSVVFSPLLPIALVRRAEPDTRMWVDPTVVMAGGLGWIVLVCVWASVVSRRASGHLAGGTGVHHRASRFASWLARSGVRPVPVTGVRFAYEAGVGRSAVPVRAAIAGGAMCVAGVVVAAVIVTSLTTLTGTPSRWGWNWSSQPDVLGDVETTLASLAADDRIDAVGRLSYASVDIDGEQMAGYAVEIVKGTIGFTVLRGRPPSNRGEVALGIRTLSDLGLTVGDTARFTSPDRSGVVELAVVGAVSTPLVQSTDPGRGAVLTGDGLDAVRQSDGDQQLLLRYREGVDAARLEAELVASSRLGFPIYARPDPPGELTNLDQARGVTWALSAFFVLLGAIGVTHVVAVSVRRRRRDLGVLRALGLGRGQVRRTVLWQATTIGVTSAVVGIPVGLVVGRAVWRGLVGDMGVVVDPDQPWLVLLLVVPAAVVLALVAGWFPSRNVGRHSPAVELRAE